MPNLTDDDYGTSDPFPTDDATDSDHPISDDEESARDEYLNKLGRIIEQVQDELEAESTSADSISVDQDKITEAIETLTELLHIRSEQLTEKDLPPHVDEKVEEYR